MEIPTEYYGLVIGRHEANLLEISKETGAEVTRIRGKVHIIQGTNKGITLSCLSNAEW